PLPASAAVVICAPAGGGHPQQPEARRQLAVMLSGTCTITATGETRSFGPGDVLLVEDTTGSGHSSTTSDGFTALLVSLE
ncbi:MAG TPA: cupin domain-containing protein, partial [Nocardioidaceae bacterium]|nr:cupin domain-containing protein [Nocardioidaceae bacterium]